MIYNYYVLEELFLVSAPLGNKPWSLGEYIRQHGGTQNRSKKVWGICIPFDVMEDNFMSTHDSLVTHDSVKVYFVILA